jgi:glutathione synthase/RimK-type ligase-like ATP-grasp enzyme
MRDVVLVTGRDMPVVETETPLLLAALRGRGVDSAIEIWRDDASSAGRLVVVRTTWDYTEHREEFLSWAHGVDAVTRLVNPVDVLAWSSHKGYLLDLIAAGVAVVPTTLVPRGSSVDAQRGVLAVHEGQVVIKPTVSAGANGVLRAGAQSEAATAHLARLTDLGDVLVQPFEPAVLAGEVSLLYFGDTLSHAVRKVPAAGDFRVQAHLGGTHALHVATAAERAVGAAALAVAPNTLTYARVDLVTTAAGPAVMELELVEPELFLHSDAGAPGRFADHLVEVLSAL